MGFCCLFVVFVCLLLGFLKTIVSSVRQFINLHTFRLGYDVLSFGLGGMCFPGSCSYSGSELPESISGDHGGKFEALIWPGT